MKLVLALFLGLLVMFGGLLFVYKIQTQSPAIPVATVDPDPLDTEKLWTLVNNFRVSEGLQPFIKNDWLCKLAEERLTEIKSDYSHDGFNGKRFCPPSLFPNGCKYVGENLAITYHSQEVLNKWLASPEHRQNLEYPFTDSCIATEPGYAVQTFLLKNPQPVQPQTVIVAPPPQSNLQSCYKRVDGSVFCMSY